MLHDATRRGVWPQADTEERGMEFESRWGKVLFVVLFFGLNLLAVAWVLVKSLGVSL